MRHKPLFNYILTPSLKPGFMYGKSGTSLTFKIKYLVDLLGIYFKHANSDK